MPSLFIVASPLAQPLTKRLDEGDEFIDSHDYRYGVLLKDMAEGKDVLSRSKEWGSKYSQVRVLKEKMEADLREHMGADAVADAMRRPAWFGDLHAERERAACRVH